ncbi:carboxymuconolactone decarboxylase family protein [Halomonas sp. WWR20]
MYDSKNLEKISQLEANAKRGMEAFWAFDKAAFAEGAIDGKTKQLLALAVAMTTQCPYCIELHTQAARDAGANDAELSETALVAAAIRAGGAITHATHMFKD